MPFLIREKWQVAQLNYVQGQGPDDIRSIEAHNQTDEVFVLTAGRALLITADRQGDNVAFEMHPMEQRVVYNVPQGVWHNIVLDGDTEILIVENADTHLNDCEYYYLNDAQKKTLYGLIAEYWK